MLIVAIIYLAIGYTEFLTKKLGGQRNELSTSIFRIMRNIGWLMLVASFFNFFYESIYWNLAFVGIAFFAIKIIQIANKIQKADLADLNGSEYKNENT